eukprot:m.81699 g.81699  ORF g.81699 m.81699 type:complete len:531 (-) comp12822_c0_seq4:126-1718(-)
MFVAIINIILLHASKNNKPNFFFFLADDLGYGDLASWGHPTSQTPNMDRLANEGMKLVQYYSPSPVCSPARAGILTGRYPVRVGVYCANDTEACAKPELQNCCNGVFLPGMPGGLPSSEQTIASYLHTSGYRSMLIGKWHLGNDVEYLPTRRGFDEYFGCPHGLGACPLAACFPPNEPCAIAGNPDWAPCPLFSNETIVKQPLDMLTVSQEYTSVGKHFMQKNVNENTPFLLYYASHHVHSPQFAGIDATNMTQRGRFGDSLLELDIVFGHLLDALETMGVENDTIVFFTSDNGPSLRNEIRGGDAGLFRCGKGTTWEGGFRVPAMVRWPGKIAAGSVYRDMVSGLDFLPTILEIAGVSSGHVSLDGYSMVNSWIQKKPSPRTHFMYYPQFPQKSRGIFATRAGVWKVHWKMQGSLQCGSNNTDSVCLPTVNYTILNPPRVYQIMLDPGEHYPLNPESDDYQTALTLAQQALRQHNSGFSWYLYPLLNNGTWNPNLQPCCVPGCKPFPSCCRCGTSGDNILYPWLFSDSF